MLQGRFSDGAAITARPRVKRNAMRRSRPEQARFSGRSREGVRVRALQKQFRAEIGEDADSTVVALAIRNAAELTMLAEMQRAALIRGENVDLSNLLRLEGVARRAIADMRQLAREVRGEAQPSMSIEEHLAAYSAVEPREARKPSGRGGTAPSPRSAPCRRGGARQTALYKASDDGGRR